MESGNFYFICDTYFQKFREYGVMRLSKQKRQNENGRPCYYAFQDGEDEKIYWMIPISSKYEKYQEQYKKFMEKYGICDGIAFGYVRGRKAAFFASKYMPSNKRLYFK